MENFKVKLKFTIKEDVLNKINEFSGYLGLYTLEIYNREGSGYNQFVKLCLDKEYYPDNDEHFNIDSEFFRKFDINIRLPIWKMIRHFRNMYN